jgi:stearoyl-CoA desaturase (Delta-9 desaturase)
MRHNAVGASEQFWMGVFIIVPFLALIVGTIPLWGFGADWISIGLFVAFYYFTAIGITVGFHRGFTHHSFRINKPWVKYLLAISGSMAAEGSVFRWVGWHMKHHQMSDKEGDPHSPHLHGGGFWNCLKGAYHSHVGWLFVTPEEDIKFTRKLREDKILVRVDRWFVPVLILGLILPPLIGVCIRQSFEWVHVDFLWGGLVRLFFTHHVTWCVNSVCHMWGSRPFETDDESTNNVAIAFLASGEGFHNCHHAHPRSAKHGLLKGQFDVSWYVIRGMEKAGWVDKVYVPKGEQIKTKLKPSVQNAYWY